MGRLCEWAPPSLPLTFSLVGVFQIWVPLGLFLMSGKENELVFYMCLFRTVTWNASRRGGEGSDRQTLFQVACAGPGSQECYPHGTLWNLGRELGSRPPPQRGGFWGQWAGLRFQVDISAQTKGLWYEGLKREGQNMWKAVHRMRLFC